MARRLLLQHARVPKWPTAFVGVGAYALDRAQALAGNPNPTIVGFLAPPNPAFVVGDGLLPSSLDGQTTAACRKP